MSELPEITPSTIESIRIGLIKQMMADRMRSTPDHQPAVMALVFNGILHGHARIDSMHQTSKADVDSISTHHFLQIRISYITSP